MPIAHAAPRSIFRSRIRSAIQQQFDRLQPIVAPQMERIHSPLRHRVGIRRMVQQQLNVAREGAYLERIAREGDFLQEWDIAGNVLAEIIHAQCRDHMRKIGYPQPPR